ncbi:MAG: hypothetical protein JW808_09020 [Victivallales bacterium]|nr:hypothetical protein [Victivallales bacterium]
MGLDVSMELQMKRHIWMSGWAFFLAGCGGIPNGVEFFGDFGLDMHLGRPYKFASLVHSLWRML